MVFMKKKGFTLVELLAVIVILALLSAIILPVVGKMLKSNEAALSQEQIDSIITIAKKYAIENSDILPDEGSEDVYELGIDELMDEGYLDKDSVIDPKTKESVSGYVSISYDSTYNQYKYEYVAGTASSNVSEYLFSYVSEGNNKEQTFDVPKTGYYKLEVWGAQGGSVSGYRGGYGGYSSGYVYLTAGTTLYVNVGGQGSNGHPSTRINGGYNGGGYAASNSDDPSDRTVAGGGGATHIALSSGILASFDTNSNGVADADEIGNILIVAGGGGGGYAHSDSNYRGIGGDAGGATGVSGGYNYGRCPGTGATQSAGGNGCSTNGTYGKFGVGGNVGNSSHGSAGGGGFYGGGGSKGYIMDSGNSGGGGGSGYIGYSNLLDGVMYCYGCSENGNSGTKTVSTTGNSASCRNGYNADPISRCAKANNGYAKITYVGKNIYSSVTSETEFVFPYVTSVNDKEQSFTVPKKGYYKLEVWGAQGASVSSYKGGYGGYSSGIVYLNANTNLYINVGGVGVAQTDSVSTGTSYAGGYNGGGYGYNRGTTSSLRTGGGGGATHIATVSGTLSSLSEYKNTGGENISNEVLIVAGGGASAYGYGSSWWNGNSGGGFTGGYSPDQSYAATQTTGYQFGLAGSSYGTGANYAGAGGGWYGGISAWGEVGAGGGSGYIRNPNLTSGVMYCYGCTENNNSGTKTVSTTGSNRDSANCPSDYSSGALTNCAKAGNGYAVITYIGKELN